MAACSRSISLAVRFPSPRRAAARSAGLADLLEAIVSVEEVGIYKPHQTVYRRATERLGLWPGELLFVSANGWDAHGASAFGFRVAWCNRAGQPAERLPGKRRRGESERRSDSGQRDLRPYIEDVEVLDVDEAARTARLRMVLRLDPSGAGRPEDVVAALDLPVHAGKAVRTRLLFVDTPPIAR